LQKMATSIIAIPPMLVIVLVFIALTISLVRHRWMPSVIALTLPENIRQNNTHRLCPIQLSMIAKMRIMLPRDRSRRLMANSLMTEA